MGHGKELAALGFPQGKLMFLDLAMSGIEYSQGHRVQQDLGRLVEGNAVFG